MTNREKAIQYVKELDDDFFSDLIVRSHNNQTHKWIEVYPNGNVHETEEADNNTSHWVEYPKKEVECIYDIHQESCEACSCDTCYEYRNFEELSKEEFIEEYSEEAWNYWQKYGLESALLDVAHDNGVYEEDIRDEIIRNIENIYHGYFDDEDDAEEE